jgi:rifampicin phosphotransferase
MKRSSNDRPGMGRIAFCMALLFAGMFSVGVSNAQISVKESVGKIGSRAEFDELARTYDPDTPYALPHVLFVIDRQKGNRIYFVNTRRYKFHKDFINGTYLSLEKGKEFFENNYINPNRRFILGTVAFQTPIKKWTFEFWEGDLIPGEQIELTSRIINANFFESVAFKPNSLRQDDASAILSGVRRVLQNEISKEQAYEPLNINKGLGRIHIIEKLDDHVEIGFNEILILKEVPVSLPPVAGIITTTPSTPLSHINLLAKSWGIPNAYIKNADQLFKEFDTRWVSFEARRDNYSIKLADNSQLDEYQKRLAARLDLMRPRFNLKIKKLADLSQQRAGSVVAYGAKSANLGEVMNARLQGIYVPGGFTIPFSYYDQFVRENGFDTEILALLDDQKFVHDPSYRREKLNELRNQIQAGKFDPQLRTELIEKVKREFPDKGLFVRSSTNSEDLPNFNGAGLYTTVPNVKGEQKLIDAIKTVWASVWNFEAYEARERAGIDHTKVFMAVLIQEGINSDSSGVMITTDPYNSGKNGAIYISAKRGLGIKVVEGEKIAEQILFRPQSNAVQILTRSAEDSLLTFDENGGVKEVPISGDRNVLTDEVIRRLVRAGTGIKRIFRNKDQDIEWAYQHGRIYIVQSRPYISGS